MKLISFEALAPSLGLTQEKKQDHAQLPPAMPTRKGMLLPLEALKSLLARTDAKKHTKSTEPSSGNTKPGTSYSVDVTDQYVGKSLIISGAKKPSNE